jgi:class III lanthionine synthetase
MLQPQDTSMHQLFMFASPEYYEPLTQYNPHDALLSIVRAVLPSSWKLTRREFWFHVSPPELELPQQGWKIHISATINNCEEILRKVASLCGEDATAFKFVLDQRCLKLTTSKIWPRGASGKFITIYPRNEEHFLALAAKLAEHLQNFKGPYILSDRRYPGSSVVYYRYGGIKALGQRTFRGDRQLMLVNPQGKLVPDTRTPYWNPPSWVSDPLKEMESEQEASSEPLLKQGQYRITQALKFSTTGGVYLATDTQNDATVIIKEARPGTEIDGQGHDAIDRLRKEYRLLQKLSESRYVPTPLDLFEDWEHLFLVEEYIVGTDLGMFTIHHNPLVQPYPAPSAIESYREHLRLIWANLARGIAFMHAQGIHYGDFSIKNVIVKNAELGEICFIDLEAAWDQQIDTPTRLGTPGYTSPQHTTAPGKTTDYYGLGALMVGTLFPITALFALAPEAKDTFIRETSKDLHLPECVQSLLVQCQSYDADARPTPQRVVEVLKEVSFERVKETTAPEPEVCRLKLEQLVRSMSDYMRGSADLKREDRLFPADPQVYTTNPLSLAYGAVGVAYALKKIDGEVPATMRCWLLRQSVTQEGYAPGLYVGMSGVAWGLWEIGLEEAALQIMKSAERHPLLWHSADIFYGASGYGLACLHFYLNTGEQIWLDRAVQVGDELLRTKRVDEHGHYSWPTIEKKTRLGYAFGASGIAQFLLYLSLVCHEQRFLSAGEHGLDFDLSHLLFKANGQPSVPRGLVGSDHPVISHYWLDGSAGVVSVLARYFAVTGKDFYREHMESLALDTFRKYTMFPMLFQGLAGLGNCHLDAYRATGDERYLREARRTAQGILLYQIQRPQGIAYPGAQLLRISTDFGTGAAGVALFLQRLAHVKEQSCDFNFSIDQVLEKNGSALLA